jgi:hypothetical protein
MHYTVKRALLRKSGIGLPHSTTSRKEWRAIRRDSVMECGSPMPLSRLYCSVRKPRPTVHGKGFVLSRSPL